MARRVSRIAKFVINQQDATFHGKLQGELCGPSASASCDANSTRLVAAADFASRLHPIRAQYNGFVATYHVENFGCRATQADGAAIERQLLDRGMERAGAAVEAEVVVLNTCTVTASADQDARATIRRIHRENPEARILVTGCYAQRAPEELSALPGVSLVVGNSHKHQLADYAAPLASQRRICSACADRQRRFQADRWRHLRPHRTDGRAGVRRRFLREDAPQSQGAGRLQ